MRYYEGREMVLTRGDGRVVGVGVGAVSGCEDRGGRLSILTALTWWNDYVDVLSVARIDGKECNPLEGIATCVSEASMLMISLRL